LSIATLVVAMVAAVLPVAYAASSKSSTVDSGVFAISVNGQRVATESFQIQQSDSGSTATSEFKTERGEKSVQKSELQMTPAGDLRRYEWREISPGKARLSVEPSDDFLMQQVTPNSPGRATQTPFVLPRSTVILDDYFFSHREILAWRYLAQACNGKLQECRPGPLEFGALIPQQSTPAMVSMEYAGPEKLNIAGKEVELNRLKMKVEDADWVLYLDNNLKLVRIVVPAEQTEVVRQ
jgi:hypothetical protein